MDVKKCRHCNQEKPISEFSRQKKNKDGFGTKCKPCCKVLSQVYYHKNKEHLKAKAKAYMKANGGILNKKDIDLRHRHGISLDEYNALLELQEGKCAICGGNDYGAARYKHFTVDHNHVTGKIRGLLCGNCNTGLGQFKDNKEHLYKAIAYLEKNK